MQFAFFCNMKTFKFFLENYQFCQKSGNYANSRGREEGGGQWSGVMFVASLWRSAYENRYVIYP